MQQVNLETRPLYGIGTVARLTGLKPDTLRIWERRYGLGASHKSDTGRRQYTQADLEHLQLVAALIESGSRIGEIAASDRKTLEMLCRRQAGKAALPPSKARVLFLGAGFCEWVDQHQGCLANIDATLARQDLVAMDPESLGFDGELDVLAVEANLSSALLERIEGLVEKLKPTRVLLCSRFQSERWQRELEQRNIIPMDFPPESPRLIFEISRIMAEKETAPGDLDLGELVTVKPREYSSAELSAARAMQSKLECECPRHLSDLIRALSEFEDYSASCSVDNWKDATVHACIFAYAGQARWLMERALGAALEHRDEEFHRELALVGHRKAS